MSSRPFHVGRAHTGLGLFATRVIKRNGYIATYRGPILTTEEAEKRERQGAKYMFELTKKLTIDGSPRWNVARYMNHSCNPNCRMFPVTRHHGDNRIYDLAFFSLRDLPPMTELTFDYNPTWKGDKTVDPNAVRCLCGEDKCRGQLWPNQRKSTKNEF